VKASVRPDCSDPKHPERRCTEADLYGASLERVRFLVTPGRATRVDGILLKGNLVTQPGEIKNELLFDEGEPLGTDDLFRSQSNLRSLGIFEAVKIETITTEGGGDEEPAGVVVTVEEGDSILLDTGVGLRIDSEPLSTTDLPVLYVLQSSIRDTNFLGHALELGLGAEHANRIDTPTDTAGDDATWLVGPFLRNRRFLRTKLDLRLELTYSLGRTLARDQYREAYTAEAVLGYDFYHMSWPRSWGRGLLWTMSVEYSRERRRGLTSAGERPVFGDPVNALAIRPGIRLDKRDNALHPTRGYSVELASEVVFNSDELAGLANPSFKETLIGQYVTSFLDRRLILAGSLGAGAVQTDLAEEDLPADFLFKAGGDAVALPVRGYPDASIEASGVRALEAGEVFTSVGGEAMTIGSFEARFPTFVLDDWWFAFFADVGAVAPTWPDMTPDRIFPSVGGGIRWLLLSQIPIRLDLGIPLRATAQSDRLDPRLHLNIFYTF
jgi:outer membrane protein assembly factor BamA